MKTLEDLKVWTEDYINQNNKRRLFRSVETNA